MHGAKINEGTTRASGIGGYLLTVNFRSLQTNVTSSHASLVSVQDPISETRQWPNERRGMEIAEDATPRIQVGDDSNEHDDVDHHERAGTWRSFEGRSC